jgi:hypothetical protein
MKQQIRTFRTGVHVAAFGLASSVLSLAFILPSVHADDKRDSDQAGARHPRFSFALWGDMPYAKSSDLPKIPALLADINADQDLAFNVFDGDIKDGSSQCTDSQFDDAIVRFNSLKTPTVYVPGDNEWTDCHRTNNGGYDNLERLDFLRRTMFSSAKSFGQRKLSLQHQGPLGGLYSENTRWRFGDVLFVTINMPGSNNNKVNALDATDCMNKSARTLAQCEADNAEYAARDAANISFVKQTFAIANANGAIGVMVIAQADPGFDLPETESVNERNQPGLEGYTAFLTALASETQAFGGDVVYVHGDTHFFKIDKPLIDQAHLIPNFTRLETFGSPNIHWVKVTVDPRARNVFHFEPMIVPGN